MSKKGVDINKERFWSIILIGLLFSALSFMFLISTQKNFKATTDFLVVQDQSGSQDFYTLFKSAEYVSNILGDAVYSELFINEIVSSGKVNEDFLPKNKKERLDEWGRMIGVSRNLQSGIIKITVFGNDQKETLAISEGVGEIMSTKNYLFRGKADLDVRRLSGPILEQNPTINDIVLAIMGGFFAGMMISIVWMYYFSSDKNGRVEQNNYE